MFEFWNGKKILITGHTGFKGSWLAFWLKSLGAEICGYALEPETDPNLFACLQLETEIRSVFGDIRDLSSFEKVANDFQPEIIFHLAAQSLVRRSYRVPVDTYSTNVMGTVNLLEAVRSIGSVRAVIVVTTDKVYENAELDIAYHETERLGGFDPYSSSKACAELVTAAYRSSFFPEGPTLIATARAGNVIGGGDWSENRLMPDVFRSLVFGEKLPIRNPDSVRPWQHVLDPLNGYLKLAERLFAGERSCAEAWNFGPAEEEAKPVVWILEEIKRVWDGPINWEIDRDDQLHEARLLKLNSSKAQSRLDWSPKLGLDQAVNLTVDWYRGFRNKENLIDLTKKQIDFFQARDATKAA